MCVRVCGNFFQQTGKKTIYKIIAHVGVCALGHMYISTHIQAVCGTTNNKQLRTKKTPQYMLVCAQMYTLPVCGMQL